MAIVQSAMEIEMKNALKENRELFECANPQCLMMFSQVTMRQLPNGSKKFPKNCRIYVACRAGQCPKSGVIAKEHRAHMQCGTCFDNGAMCGEQASCTACVAEWKGGRRKMPPFDWDKYGPRLYTVEDMNNKLYENEELLHKLGEDERKRLDRQGQADAQADREKIKARAKELKKSKQIGAHLQQIHEQMEEARKNADVSKAALEQVLNCGECEAADDFFNENESENNDNDLPQASQELELLEQKCEEDEKTFNRLYDTYMLMKEVEEADEGDEGDEGDDVPAEETALVGVSEAEEEVEEGAEDGAEDVGDAGPGMDVEETEGAGNEMEVEEAADSVDAAKELKRAKAREYYRENKEKKKEQKAREKEEIEENRFKVIEYERQVKDIFKSFKSNWPVLQTMDFRDAKKRVAEEVRGLAYARLTGEVSSPRADQEDDAAADPIDDEEESEPVGKKATKSKKSKAAA